MRARHPAKTMQQHMNKAFRKTITCDMNKNIIEARNSAASVARDKWYMFAFIYVR